MEFKFTERTSSACATKQFQKGTWRISFFGVCVYMPEKEAANQLPNLWLMLSGLLQTNALSHSERKKCVYPEQAPRHGHGVCERFTQLPSWLTHATISIASQSHVGL